MAKYELNMGHDKVLEMLREAESLNGCTPGIDWAKRFTRKNIDMNSLYVQMGRTEFLREWVAFMIAHFHNKVSKDFLDMWIRKVSGSDKMLARIKKEYGDKIPQSIYNQLGEKK